jgi:hypothetical protein
MLLPVSVPVISTYCVEVSGWDNSPSFFTEKSELEWGEETGKQIKLSRALPKGTMIFVRLLQPTVSDHSSAVAYWAEYIATTPEGFHQFHLKQVQPRT